MKWPRWKTILAYGLPLVFAYQCYSLYPPNLQSGLPKRWEPGCPRYTAEWQLIADPVEAEPWAMDGPWFVTAQGLIGTQFKFPIRRGFATPKRLIRHGEPEARSYSPAFLAEQRVSGLRIPDREENPGRLLLIAPTAAPPGLRLLSFDEATLEYHHSVDWAPTLPVGSAPVELRVETIALLSDGRVACVIEGHPLNRKSYLERYWLVHIAPDSLAVSDPIRLKLLRIHGYAAQRGDSLYLQDFESAAEINLITGEIKHSPAPSQILELNTRYRKGWDRQIYEWRNADPPFVLAVSTAQLPLASHEQQRFIALQRVKDEALELLPADVTQRVHRQEVRTELVEVVRSKRDRSPISGDLLQTLKHYQEPQSLSAMQMPGVGLLVLQPLDRLPEALDSPNGLLRIGVLGATDSEVQWQGWIPFPGTMGLDRIDMHFSEVYVGEEELTLIILLRPSTFKPTVTAKYYRLDVPRPDGTDELVGRWLASAR